MKADLHTHTTCSDGTLSPQELVEAAIAAGLDVLSITDHDTVKAYEMLVEPAIQLIPGIEFSAQRNSVSVHILGYSFDPFDPVLKEFCVEQNLRRTARNERILHNLREMGIAIEELEEKIGSIGRPHIAKMLIKQGVVRSVQEAFDLFLGDGKPAFAAGERPDVREVIEVLHEVGGFAVIAHPHLIRDQALVHELLQEPFDGIEAYYAHFPAKQARAWLQLADAHGLFVTGGSDYHGDIKQYRLGSSMTPGATLDILLKK